MGTGWEELRVAGVAEKIECGERRVCVEGRACLPNLVTLWPRQNAPSDIKSMILST